MKSSAKEVKIAITAIAAVVIMFVGINFLKGINVFKSSNFYYVAFENIQGLTASSPVYADGYSIGIVRSINYDYEHPGNVIVEIEVDKDMRIPKGTSAELVTEMLGTVKMNLLLATNPHERCEPGDTIRGGVNAGALGAAANMVPEIQALLPKLDSILTSVNTLLADPALTGTLHNAERITANLDVTTQQLNRLMAGDIPQLTKKLNVIAGNFEETSAKLKELDVQKTLAGVDATLANVQTMTDDLNKKMNSKDNNIGLMLNDRSIYDNLNAATANAASLMKDLQENPKRYVHFSVWGKSDKKKKSE